jgi:hypothetical protein
VRPDWGSPTNLRPLEVTRYRRVKGRLEPFDIAGGGVLPVPRNRPVTPIEVAQDSGACGRPGLRMATPAFNSAWRTVSGLTWNSLPIEAQESPEA